MVVFPAGEEFMVRVWYRPRKWTSQLGPEGLMGSVWESLVAVRAVCDLCDGVVDP